jgi:hypothetical protein
MSRDWHLGQRSGGVENQIVGGNNHISRLIANAAENAIAMGNRNALLPAISKL